MEIGPIPSIVAIPVKVSPSVLPDLPSTRAVAFYPQQEDSSYTPSGQGQHQDQSQDQQAQSEPDQQETGEQNLMQTQSFTPKVIETKDITPEGVPGDPPAESTISLFA